MSQGAEIRGLDQQWMSPFAKGALKDRKNFMGGKEDDITVVVAQIR